MIFVSYGNIPRYYAERKPADAVALIYPDGQFTWWQLEKRATQRARLFQSLGVQQGDMVTVALPNCLAFYETTFAIWKCGATPCLVSSRLPAHEFRALLELARPRLVVADGLAVQPGFLCVASSADVSGFDDAPIDAPASPYWKAMTSGGSTGRPKLIVDHGLARIDVDAPGSQRVWQMAPGMTILNPGPLYHNAPFLATHLGLFVGCKVVGMARFDAEEMLRLVEAHRANWMMLVPTMMHRIWSLPQQVRNRYDLSSIRVVWHGAAACPVWLKEAWIDWIGGNKIWEMYGGTEGLGAAIINGDEWLAKRGSVGRSIVPGGIKIFRQDGTECVVGEIGELFFMPPDPTVIPSHYVGAEPKKNRQGGQSIGDLGHMDGDGYIFLADRRTDLIVRGGVNIYPAEIEAALEAHPNVASSVVVSIPCEELGHRIHAIVQPRAGQSVELRELDAFLRNRLIKYKLPESYELSDIPLRDDAGKARRSAIREERNKWLSAGREFRIQVKQ